MSKCGRKKWTGEMAVGKRGEGESEVIRIHSVTVRLRLGMYLNSMKFKQKTFWRKKRSPGFAKDVKRMHKRNDVTVGSDLLSIVQLQSSYLTYLARFTLSSPLQIVSRLFRCSALFRKIKWLSSLDFKLRSGFTRKNFSFPDISYIIWARMTQLHICCSS